MSQPPGFEEPDFENSHFEAGFVAVAERVLDALLQAAPERATELGDHRFDDRMPDLSADGLVERSAMLSDALAALDTLDDSVLDVADQVDLEILRTEVARETWIWGEWRPQEHDPLVHLPGDALYSLVARESGDPRTRAVALASRLRGVAGMLEAGRAQLRSMPTVHVETAIVQTRGIAGMLGDLGPGVESALGQDPALRVEMDDARVAAASELEAHARWLQDRLADSDGDPRLGAAAYAARLWYTLDTETGPDALLMRAESDLLAVEESIAELASRIAGTPSRAGLVREVLDRLAEGDPVTDATILPRCEEAVARLTARVRELDLVSVPDGEVRLIVMPEARRGVAVAYCEPPGALEPGPPQPTFFAVSPTPSDWAPERVRSFYREYNGHMVRDLAVHEAMPGHVLQLAHAAAYSGRTAVRAALRSGPFVEGWAVYAEALMAGAGLGGETAVDDGLRMHQLKMQLRSTINAILDVRVHAHGMTEAEAMSLMVDRGHQEEGEAAGKWRRALLTSAQLSTYYVGYHEVGSIVRDLGAVAGSSVQNPSGPGASAPGPSSMRRVHDSVLAHGSPPPRHLRALLGLTGP